MRVLSVFSAVALGMAISSSQALARTEACKPVGEKEIAALFERWNNSLKTGAPEKVVANYDRKSTLLPTLSNTPRLTPEAKIEYFRHFLEKMPVGKIDSRAIEIDCNSAVDTGLYTFTFKDGTAVKARYTFTYKWNGKQWLITSHHSSLMPNLT